MEPEPVSPAMQLVAFTLDQSHYALPLRDCVEVQLYCQLAPLPTAPSVIAGLLDWHGTAVPVIDFRARFALPSRLPRADDQLLLARTPARLLALWVDQVRGIVEITTPKIMPMAKLSPQVSQLNGITLLDGEILYIHDLATVLSEAEEAGLDAALATMPETLA